MTEQTSMTQMAWEQQFSDKSGIEFAVRFDSMTDEKAMIEFEAIGMANFPSSKIDWLIDCLQKIKEEQGL